MILQPLLPIPVLGVVIGGLVVLTGTLVVAGLRQRTPAGHRQARAWLRRLAIVAVVAVIGLGPSLPKTSTDTSLTAVDMFFVVDRTGSMAAEDYNGTQPRLDGVRADINALVEAVPGARYSIISFDSEASRQLPLTTDARAVQAWTQSMNREVTTRSRGSMVDRPLDVLSRALTGSAEQRPANIRLVFFMTDGENTADGQRRSFADLAPLIDSGAVLGYGSDEGGRMKEYSLSSDGDGEEGTYIKDPSLPGTPDALSIYDPVELAALGDELGLEYVHRTAPDEIVSLVAGLNPAQIAADGRRSLTSYQLLLWPFALLLAVLLAAEAAASGRHLGRKVGVDHA